METILILPTIKLVKKHVIVIKASVWLALTLSNRMESEFLVMEEQSGFYTGLLRQYFYTDTSCREQKGNMTTCHYMEVDTCHFIQLLNDDCYYSAV